MKLLYSSCESGGKPGKSCTVWAPFGTLHERFVVTHYFPLGHKVDENPQSSETGRFQ